MTIDKQNFIGFDGFIWFIGVVEDRYDPFKAGRVRVRCFGHHTGNKTDLPTEDLPWAQVMLPVTSSGISGIGQTPLGLVEGSHVFGFFRDGEDRQELVVMGALPGVPMELGDPNKGFYSPIESDDETLKGKSDYPRWIGSPDTNQLATGEDYSYYGSPFHSIARAYAEDLIKIDVESLPPVAIMAHEQMQLASAFIQKGTSSLFGFVSDIITDLALKNIGNSLMSVAGNLVTNLGITQYATNTIDSITTLGNDILEYTVGMNATQISNSVMSTAGSYDGVLATTIMWPKSLGDFTPLSGSLNIIGGSLTETFDSTLGNVYKLDIKSPSIMKDMLIATVASNENLQLYQQAEAIVASGQTLPGGGTAVDQSILSNRTVTGQESTIQAQGENLDSANQKVDAVASSGEGMLPTYNKDGVMVAVAGGIGTDSITQQGRILGSQGEILRTKSTTTKAGKTKLMADKINENDGTWSVPGIPEYEAAEDPYPKKHVFETESGHLMVYDDNFGHESILQMHRTGTRYHIAHDGTKVDRVVSDHITAVQGTSYKVVQEDENVTVEGHYKITVNKSKQKGNHYEIAVGDNANVSIMIEKGDFNVNVLDGRINMNCSDNFNVMCGGEMNVISQGDMSLNSMQDDITLKAGDKIFLN